MKLKNILFVFVALIFCGNLFAKNDHAVNPVKAFTDTIPVDSTGSPPPLRKFSRKEENKKVIAAILAFPVPFGFIGLHRIYLGTDPWVPVVYFCTGGGAMILPLIDFLAIITADPDELASYENNAKVFMWVK